ncbi:MAG: hypothetical protein ABW026_15915 [Microvirga sp.]
MEQPREPTRNADAGRLITQAMDLTPSAPASDPGTALRAAILKGPEGMRPSPPSAPHAKDRDPITQARLLLAEQHHHFDAMRSAVVQMGQSLDLLNGAPNGIAPSPTMTLLNAQSEAIQGLTLLVLKGQQMQMELINAVDAQAHRVAESGIPGWAYTLMGFMMVWGLLGIYF